MFYFQAEDGIRDGHVTGVQTCALPIYELDSLDGEKIIKEGTNFKNTVIWNKLYPFQRDGVVGIIDKIEKHNGRSEERRVGKEGRYERMPYWQMKEKTGDIKVEFRLYI